jgi:hypothetical protein
VQSRRSTWTVIISHKFCSTFTATKTGRFALIPVECPVLALLAACEWNKASTASRLGLFGSYAAHKSAKKLVAPRAVAPHQKRISAHETRDAFAIIFASCSRLFLQPSRFHWMKSYTESRQHQLHEWPKPSKHCLLSQCFESKSRGIHLRFPRRTSRAQLLLLINIYVDTQLDGQLVNFEIMQTRYKQSSCHG